MEQGVIEMLEFISTHWSILVTIVGWIIVLVKDHVAIRDIKHDVTFLKENVDIKEIELIKKSYDSLEARYDTLSNEIVSIKTILSEISTKVSLLVEGKINTNGEK